MREIDHELKDAPGKRALPRPRNDRDQPEAGTRPTGARPAGSRVSSRTSGSSGGSERRGPRTVPPELAAELAAIAAGAGCELAHMELKGNVLRLVLDRESEGGITLADCEHVSKQASAVLDLADFGSGRYVLEVSSPGLDRELYGPRDYRRFTGRLVRVTYETPEGKKRTVTGRLTAFTGSEETGGGPGTATVVVEKTGEELQLGLDRIRLARLEIEL
jgi:ribosome maturation factor RimP